MSTTFKFYKETEGGDSFPFLAVHLPKFSDKVDIEEIVDILSNTDNILSASIVVFKQYTHEEGFCFIDDDKIEDWRKGTVIEVYSHQVVKEIDGKFCDCLEVNWKSAETSGC